MIKPLTVIAVIIVIVLFASETILGQFSSLRLIGSRGKVKVVGVEAYWDKNLTNKTQAIDWGIIWPGSSQNVTLYIRSISNIEITLILNTTNWNPAKAFKYITLTWDYNGYILYPDQTTRVTLTLSIAPIIEGIKDFTFDIIIGVNG